MNPTPKPIQSATGDFSPAPSGPLDGSDLPLQPNAPRPLPWWRRFTRFTSRTGLRWLLAVAVGVVISIPLFYIPFNYVLVYPGPTLNVIGNDAQGQRIIQVEDAPTYPTTGKLLMTTVSTVGGPENPVRGIDILRAFLTPGSDIQPLSERVPQGMTANKLRKIGAAQMLNSQQVSQAVALYALGYDISARLEVGEVVKGSASAGKLQAGDILLQASWGDKHSLDLSKLDSLNKLSEDVAAGTEVTFQIRRGGQEYSVPITPQASPTDGHPVFGFAYIPDVTLPVKIDFTVDEISGPSAGTMFALGIVDEMTPGSLTGGERIAGTGTISLSGKVGAISGIPQKLLAARRDGAKYFLAPVDNCQEVIGKEPEGLRVVAVDNFNQALQAVEDIAAGKGQRTKTCAAALKEQAKQKSAQE